MPSLLDDATLTGGRSSPPEDAEPPASVQDAKPDSSEETDVEQKKLPFGSEFSPAQIDLRWLLEAVQRSDGDRSVLVALVREQFPRLRQQKQRADNVVIGLRAYGLIDRHDIRLSPIGERLVCAADLDEMYRALAVHILVDRHGLAVLQAIDTLGSRQEIVTKKSLSEELVRMGFIMPQATTHHLILLNWLRMVRVLPPKLYEVDHSRVAELLKTDPSTVSELEYLTQHERLFLRALFRLSDEPAKLLLVSDVVRYAQTLYSVVFPADQWQAKLLQPLQKKGWIELERGTKGRGAKSGRVRGTSRFESEHIVKLLDEDADAIPPDIRRRLRTPLDDVLAELRSDDKHVKGLALELLALRIAQMLDLQFRRYRLRSAETGYAEVDLIVEGERLVFSRWQVQCKNKSAVSLDDLAKEVGLAFMLKSHVVMMVTTGKFGEAIRRHARVVNETMALQVVLIDGQILTKVADAKGASAMVLVEELNRQARMTLQQKALQIEGVS